MATSFKTPGVYVEEISTFPPSVAQVETAIPAFIGYTQKAKKKVDDDLIMNPIRITSMLEYELYFGYAEEETSIGVTIINVGAATQEVVVSQPSSPSLFKMYYQLQMYFANGGGPCYIVAVGTYISSKTNNSLAPVILQELMNSGFKGLKDGLDRIEKVDEPTLIVFPDATSLVSDSDFYSLYNSALLQCNKLQDRFTIIDTYSDIEYNDGTNDVNPVDALRKKINLEKDFLKYGASYFPYLETVLDYAYNESSIEINGIAKSLSAIAEKAVSDIDLIALETLLTNLIAIKTDIDGAVDNATALLLKRSLMVQVKNIAIYLENNIKAINKLIIEAGGVGDASLVTPIANMNTWMDANLEVIVANLHAKLFKLEQDDSKAKLQESLTTNTVNVFDLLGIDEGTVTNSTIITDLTDQTSIIGNELIDLKDAVVALGITIIPTLNEIKDTNNALYNKIKTEISKLSIKLAPSASMSGIYARVDSTRGVWKAPANVGITNVIKTSVQISHEEQKDLNEDVNSGKSVNAIRAFTGKGIMVWGARTLAGNDNEWRYVPVRRFYIMAEESIKKATEQFVFEPNDANTWVKVRAMIENFLTLQWRAGALAGAKSDDAFYVRVGLGVTMTADDVLNGIMNVEIGMAVVRPAEFIVLKFSHKMQEA